MKKLIVCAALLLSAPLTTAPLQATSFETDARASLSAKDFLLEEYQEIAIATDLEPDDVLALKIIFKKANDLYRKHPDRKYPIQLILVGEGNTQIKRLRMEKLLAEYLTPSSEIYIPVIEAMATDDNLFPYDGEEFFSKEFLSEIPFSNDDSQSRSAAQAIERWAAQAMSPLIIQLKPGSELFLVDPKISCKISILFYGSFNLRRMADNFKQLPFPQQLEASLKQLAKQYSKIAIVETYGVLEEQSCICNESKWAHFIQSRIETSSDPFLVHFRMLSEKWNAYIFEHCFDAMQEISNELASLETDNSDFFVKLHELLAQNGSSQENFLAFSSRIEKHIDQIQIDPSMRVAWNRFLRNYSLAKKIASNNVQFTLSDVLVALAVTDSSNLFQAQPIQPAYDENGFLIPKKDPASNILYYQRVDPQAMAEKLAVSLDLS